MKTRTENPFATLRATGYAEATSWLLLLSIAMPLKYLAGIPQVVRIVGWIHGLLFIAYIIQLVYQYFSAGWPARKLLGGFVAAFLPFGTLVFDKQLR